MTNPLPQLAAIGAEVYACSQRCAGIRCSVKMGAPGRGPWVDAHGDAMRPGVLVVGMNPGRARSPERQFHRSARSYGEFVQWCHQAFARGNHYMDRLRSIIAQFEVQGPVVWSNVAKCECRPGLQGVPLPTLRACASRYLKREIDALPPEWLVLAAGRDAFNAVHYLALHNTVVGIPHPTGAAPQFYRLMRGSGRLHSPSFKFALQSHRNGSAGAFWLTPTA